MEEGELAQRCAGIGDAELATDPPPFLATTNQEYFRRRNQERKDLQRSGSAPGSGAATPSRSQRLADSGIKTTRDMREEQWKEEATQQEEGYTKNEMRSYYKEAGGSKGGKAKGVKANKGKGGSRGVDEGLWE